MGGWGGWSGVEGSGVVWSGGGEEGERRWRGRRVGREEGGESLTVSGEALRDSVPLQPLCARPHSELPP